ncbi:hypothetical protein HPB47_017601 [Ixodes persulcatus]|uniref:Uncharacterized protein n=1 Tax=Ixodes persulcatus TaxID=34615 RepID=A0AC60QQ97_IXOPE|nr:hypothetical protein HPB47_017601 [Ixodes persulcatus]
MEEGTSQADGVATSRKRKLEYKKKYCDVWEKNPEFKNWLSRSKKGPHFFHCRACDTDGGAGLSEVKKHAAGSKHQGSVAGQKKQPTLFELSIPKKNDVKQRAKEGEIRMAAFIAEHSLPFAVVDHLPDLMRTVCSDSEIAKTLTCGKTKCSGIITNVIGEASREELEETLRQMPFSLIMDESTDKGSTKHACLVTRVVDDDLNVKDEFFALLPVTDATALGLHRVVVEAFEKAGIPYKKNMIGFAADGANNMMGYRDPKNFMALKDVYLGGKVSVALAREDCKLSQEEIRAFRTRCLNFLVESAHQIYKRFPFQKCGAIKQLSDIAPKSVLSKQVGSLGPLVGKFPNLVDVAQINELDREWRLLRNTDLAGAPEDLREFWLYVGSFRKGDDTKMFPTLVAFIRKLLCLPHSTEGLRWPLGQCAAKGALNGANEPT